MDINFAHVIQEEIALEGLTGITTEALWKRMCIRLNKPSPLSIYNRRNFFDIAKNLRDVDVYELPVTRNNLTIVNLFSDANKIRVHDIPPVEDVYGFHPVNKNGDLGSCDDYDDRMNVTDVVRKLNLEQAEKMYGNKIVFVACQRRRNEILFPINSFMSLNANVYCILERIARSRYHGEISVGNNSFIKALPDDVKKNLHPRLIKLFRANLITKQKITLYTESGNGYFKATSALIYHLKRFYKERKAASELTLERIYEFIQAQPNQRVSSRQLRQFCMSAHMWKYVRKNLKCVGNDDNTPSDDCMDSDDVNADDDSTNNYYELRPETQAVRKKAVETLADDDDDDEEEEATLSNKNLLIRVPLATQVIQQIAKNGRRGLSVLELSQKLGVRKKNMRLLVKHIMHATNVVALIKQTQGRQTLAKYILRAYIENLGNPYRSDDDSDSTPIKTEKRKIKSEVNEELAAKRVKQEVCDFQLDEELEKFQRLVENASIKVMDSDPVVLVDSEQGITIETTLVELEQAGPHTTFIKDEQKCSLFKNVPMRYLKRAKFFLDSIEEQKVMENLIGEMKKIVTIEQNETNEKHTPMLDRRSVYRLLNKLSVLGLIKIYKLTMKIPRKKQETYLYCSLDVYPQSEYIQTFLRSFTANFLQSLNEYRRKAIVPAPKSKRFAKNSEVRVYGFKPKFYKAHVVHEFAIRLIYDNPNMVKYPTSDMVAHWRAQGIEITAEIEALLPTHVYDTNLGMNTFVWPFHGLPGHPTGWITLQDILHRLPLKRYLYVVRMNRRSEKVLAALKHPVLAHLPMLLLPKELQNIVMSRAKIAHTYGILQLLACLGLVQCGVTTERTLDFAKFYFNRNALLLDTRSNPIKSYMCVANIDYPQMRFYFANVQAVNSYWMIFNEIANNSNLGKRQKRYPNMEVAFRTVALADALVQKKPDEAVEDDVGYIPGDKRGAAGVSCKLFPHITRNWTTNSVVYSSKKTLLTVSKPKPKPKPKPSVPLHKTATIVKAVLEKAPSKKWRAEHRPMDDADKLALSRKKSHRCLWKPNSDRLLVSGKIVQKILEQHHFICSNKPIRDMLHVLGNDLDKTAAACTKRWAIMVKRASNTVANNQLMLYTQVKITQLQNDPVVVAYLNHYSKKDGDVALICLVKYLYELCDGDSNFVSLMSNTIVPTNMDQFLDEFEIQEIHVKSPRYQAPVTDDDIEINKCFSVFHSALSCQGDKYNWNTHLMKVYEQIGEKSMKTALRSMFEHRMITRTKIALKARLMSTNSSVLKFSSLSPLSVRYVYLTQSYEYKLMTAFSYNLFAQAYKKLAEFIQLQQAQQTQQIVEQSSVLTISSGGCCAAIIEMTLFNDFKINLTFSNSLISLDSDIKEKNEKLYNQLMRSSWLGEDNQQAPTSDSSIVALLKTIDFDQDQQTAQHSHAFFKLNAITPTFMPDNALVDAKLPLEDDLKQKVLAKILSYSKIPSTLPTPEELQQFFTEHNLTKPDILLQQSIDEFVKASGSRGVNFEQLKNHFETQLQTLTLRQHLNLLLEAKTIAKVGVTTPVYVHMSNITPWTMRTFRIKRLKREAMQTSSHIYETLPDGFDEQFPVIFAAWYKIDGTLHRRFLDRWMGAILTYVAGLCAVSFENLTTRFDDMKPFELMLLLEFLHDLTCIRYVRVTKSRVTLFSHDENVTIAEIDDAEDDYMNLFIEADPYCFTKLSLFIGKKNYGLDFPHCLTMTRKRDRLRAQTAKKN